MIRNYWERMPLILYLTMCIVIFIIDTSEFSVADSGIKDASSSLDFVEKVRRMGGNCTPGNGYTLDMNSDKSVWQNLAEIPMRSANMITKLIIQNSNVLKEFTDEFLFALVRSHIESDQMAFGSTVAFEQNTYRDMEIFSPYAYKEGSDINLRDLSRWYNYLNNDTEWYYIPKITPYNLTFFGLNRLLKNPNATDTSDDTLRYHFTEPKIELKHGHWTKPYYDCGGGNIWMITYSSPYFIVINGELVFGGVVTIDINLTYIDINQCDPEESGEKVGGMDNFRGTHVCQDTTKCKPLTGKGFRRGAYRCICRDGYYFPNLTASVKAYEGYDLEELYEKYKQDQDELDKQKAHYKCVPCSEGCDTCSNQDPCMVSYNLILRIIIITLVLGMIINAIAYAILMRIFRQYKVVRSASPIFLNIMCFGMFMMGLQGVVGYFKPNLIICTVKIWCYNIGFFMSYSALLLKTWRIAMVFKVTSAKAVRLPDKALVVRLVYLMFPLIVYLVIWTVIGSPETRIRKNSAGLKFHYCVVNFWEYMILSGRCLFLLWGVYLCFKVRKAPSSFNESKFINLAIYNTLCMSNFIFIVRVFIAMDVGPDLLYVLDMLDLQIQVTITGILIVVPKLYMILTGKGDDTSRANETQATTLHTKVQPAPVINVTEKIAEQLRKVSFCHDCKNKVESLQLLPALPKIST